MTQEDKELLLKDICSRLRYGVIILHEGWNYEWDDSLSTWERVVGMDEKFIYTHVIDSHTKEEYREDKYPISLFDDKPYLRPMSSMSEEERKEYEAVVWKHEFYNGDEDNILLYDDFEYLLDWLNSHHFDYRGLIEKGLAVEAPEGMYE